VCVRVRVWVWYFYHLLVVCLPLIAAGVKSVTSIYNYYKRHGYNTVVMGASFRTLGEITELVRARMHACLCVCVCVCQSVSELAAGPSSHCRAQAGCDLLTIGPALLEELAKSSVDVPKKLDAATAAALDIPKVHGLPAFVVAAWFVRQARETLCMYVCVCVYVCVYVCAFVSVCVPGA
jgi:hypothetical protein